MQDLTLPDDYESFLYKYPDSILVAFGTTWSPSGDHVKEIVKAAKKMPEVGMIISLQAKWEGYPIVKEANLPNIFL